MVLSTLGWSKVLIILIVFFGPVLASTLYSLRFTGTYLCFGAGISLFSWLVSGWGSLWLLSCGWFVALSSCRSVLLHC